MAILKFVAAPALQRSSLRADAEAGSAWSAVAGLDYSSPSGPSRAAMHLILYQRDDCHLCDLALDVLAQARVPDFKSIFIDGQAELEARYGERVPVLREDASGRELGWPFEVASVRRFIQA